MRIPRMLRSLMVAAILALPRLASAETPATLSAGYAAVARTESPSFGGFSAARGEAFFRATHGNDWSCASCHTTNPLNAGKHAKTGKPIEPLAPAANTTRFTSIANAEKWFKRNCNDVAGRACTAQEKGDVLAYLMNLKP